MDSHSFAVLATDAHGWAALARFEAPSIHHHHSVIRNIAMRLIRPSTLLLVILVPITLASCSSNPQAPPPSEARRLLKSCADLMPSPDPSVEKPIEVRRVQPIPPRNAGSSGFACVQGTVALDGRLTALKLLRTDNPAFVPACLDALQQWAYKPAVRSGTPVPLDIVVSLSFSRH